MGLTSKIEAIVQNKKFKKFLTRLYGLGASVVILGALFKIEHWTGASLMLSAGLITESVIFFFFAFDSEEEPKKDTPEILQNPTYDAEGIPVYGAYQPASLGSANGSLGNGNGSLALAKFDEMLLDADISPALLERFGLGLKKLGETTENLNSMEDVSLASKSYMQTIKSADESLGRLARSYENTITKVTVNTVFKYQSIAKSLSIIEDESKGYKQQLETLNDNINVLNNVYRSQRKEAENYLRNITDAVDESKKYKQEMKELNENINALNKFYGNMLNSMNVKKRNLS
jgi:gliding motility-associated protein GldL